MKPFPALFVSLTMTGLMMPGACYAYTSGVENGVTECNKISVSTQPLFWAAGIMNAGGDFEICKKISASLSIGWSPWFITEKFAPRVFYVFPEARWWPGGFDRGHFVGLHFNVGWYNVRLGDYRYQDTNTPALGGGLTYGYKFALSDRWSLQLDFGVGYTYLKYDRFHNVDNGKKIDTRKTSYVGIDRFSVAFAYTIPL